MGERYESGTMGRQMKKVMQDLDEAGAREQLPLVQGKSFRDIGSSDGEKDSYLGR